MRKLPLSKLFLFLTFTLGVILLYYSLNSKSRDYSQNIVYKILNELSEPKKSELNHNKKTNQIERIFISFVVCDSRFNESLKVVKSVLIFSQTLVHFVIFTEEELKPRFTEVLNQWKELTHGQLSFELHLINFPKPHRLFWIKLFKKCSSQRLFIPELMTHLDALIYVDTDTLFLGPAEELWSFFYQFNRSQITALALENENPKLSWYSVAKHPIYGTTGLNSGVMLMNLTRMREFGWASYHTPIMLKWKQHIPWGDQDIINVIFHYHPGRVLELPCRFNFRTDQCARGGGSCARAGVLLLHGSRAAFRSHDYPTFQSVNRAVEEYEVGTDPAITFLPKLEKYYSEAVKLSGSRCGSDLKEAFLKVPRKTFLLSTVKRAQHSELTISVVDNTRQSLRD